MRDDPKEGHQASFLFFHLVSCIYRPLHVTSAITYGDNKNIDPFHFLAFPYTSPLRPTLPYLEAGHLAAKSVGQKGILAEPRR